MMVIKEMEMSILIQVMMQHHDDNDRAVLDVQCVRKRVGGALSGEAWGSNEDGKLRGIGGVKGSAAQLCKNAELTVSHL